MESVVEDSVSRLPPAENLDSVEDARSLLLSLGLSLRSIGKATSVDRMENLKREYPDLEGALTEFAEVLPRQVGRMLFDLLLESRERPSLSRLMAEVHDPRSFRQAASVVEIVADHAPDDVLLAYAELPKSRWPRTQICDAGLFLTSLALRGSKAIQKRDGRFWIADASVSIEELDRARSVVLEWHRTFATAAASSLSPMVPQEEVFGLVPALRPPTSLPPSLLLSDQELDKLPLLVRLSAGTASDDAPFRRMAAASLHVFLRLLQRPYAVVFQSTLRFESGAEASSFHPPSTVVVGSDGDLWSVVDALAAALDEALGDYSGPISARPGPVEAFGEAVAAGTGRSPSDGFRSFVVAYLEVLCVQQGVVPKASVPVTWVDRKIIGRRHAQFLELLLDAQKAALFEEGRRVGVHRTMSLVEAGAGAASLPLLLWLIPKVA